MFLLIKLFFQLFLLIKLFFLKEKFAMFLLGSFLPIISFDQTFLS